MQNIHFWNGNKTSARQAYETDFLETCLNITENKYDPVSLQVDNTNYPLARDESNIFDAGADILVTVAENVKFKDKQKIMIAKPLTRGDREASLDFNYEDLWLEREIKSVTNITGRDIRSFLCLGCHHSHTNNS